MASLTAERRAPLWHAVSDTMQCCECFTFLPFLLQPSYVFTAQQEFLLRSLLFFWGQVQPTQYCRKRKRVTLFPPLHFTFPSFTPHITRERKYLGPPVHCRLPPLQCSFQSRQQKEVCPSAQETPESANG
ncbi:hypothetical protein JZ751_027969 [Albula glossodonta]|uniref:Uncharacterized protein n=1 Tax=Albula glossodonta TaxID=121402 RepID=A0A8T2PA82_9TELE|nr:hypothetical protein JZ751_027969 [Albula glossodonta]